MIFITCIRILAFVHFASSKILFTIIGPQELYALLLLCFDICHHIHLSSLSSLICCSMVGVLESKFFVPLALVLMFSRSTGIDSTSSGFHSRQPLFSRRQYFACVLFRVCSPVDQLLHVFCCLSLLFSDQKCKICTANVIIL